MTHSGRPSALCFGYLIISLLMFRLSAWSNHLALMDANIIDRHFSPGIVVTQSRWPCYTLVKVGRQIIGARLVVCFVLVLEIQFWLKRCKCQLGLARFGSEFCQIISNRRSDHGLRRNGKPTTSCNLSIWSMGGDVGLCQCDVLYNVARR